MKMCTQCIRWTGQVETEEKTPKQRGNHMDCTRLVAFQEGTRKRRQKMRKATERSSHFEDLHLGQIASDLDLVSFKRWPLHLRTWPVGAFEGLRAEEVPQKATFPLRGGERG
jgi:hypothetical protein